MDNNSLDLLLARSVAAAQATACAMVLIGLRSAGAAVNFYDLAFAAVKAAAAAAAAAATNATVDTSTIRVYRVQTSCFCG